MPQKLTILVTCTDRKVAVPDPTRMVRNLPPGSIEQRAETWAAALTSSPDRTPLSRLYQGETWTQVSHLVDAASAVGYDARVVVASAGLGLRSWDHMAPAYAATFAPGHEDSVGTTTDQSRDWWAAIGAVAPGTAPVLGGPMMWVLSQSYGRVIAADLLAHSNPTDLLVFGGSDDVPASVRIPANKALRRPLGGTATSLNLKTAIRWLKLSGTDGAFATSTRERWNSWVARTEHRESYDRQRMTDAAVVDFVQALRRSDPYLSKTRALRLLRQAGLACEQRRFGVLFAQAQVGVRT